MLNSDKPNNLPRHIAVIMDGNGRWATSKGLSRSKGHRAGAENAQKLVEYSKKLGIKYLTLFTFSSENWKRPKSEVDDLIRLLRYYLRKETSEFHKSGAKLNIIGDLSKLPKDVVDMINNAMDLTKDNNDIIVTVALSYGGRQDITNAVKNIAEDLRVNKINEIDEDLVGSYMMTGDTPDPDLLIRTGAETRISNFLLWQLAYSEIYFCDVLWPDFNSLNLDKAIEFYAAKQRRFGGLPNLQENK